MFDLAEKADVCSTPNTPDWASITQVAFTLRSRQSLVGSDGPGPAIAHHFPPASFITDLTTRNLWSGLAERYHSQDRYVRAKPLDPPVPKVMTHNQST